MYFSTPQLTSRLFNVGVTMGKEILVSSNAVRHMEIDRQKVYPNAMSGMIPPPLDDDEATDTVDGQLLSHLVGEVSEVDLDETRLGSIYDLQASGRKSKNASAKKNKKALRVSQQSKSPKVSR